MLPVPLPAPPRPSTSTSEAPEAAAEPGRDLPDVLEATGEHDRVSVTGVNGTVARFEMSYSPPADERVRFAAPFRQRLPSLIFLGLALGFALLVALAYQAPDANSVFTWIAEGDRQRALTSQVFSIVMLLCAAATVLRAHMRGIIISPDWIVVRSMLPLGIPYAKRWGWPQVHRVIVDRRSIALELMDTSFNALPPVQDPKKLRDLLFMHATRKRIQITLLEDADASH